MLKITLAIVAIVICSISLLHATDDELVFMPDGNHQGGLKALPHSGDGRYLPMTVPYASKDSVFVKLFVYDAAKNQVYEATKPICEVYDSVNYWLDLGYWLSDDTFRVTCPDTTNLARAYHAFKIEDGLTRLDDLDAYHGVSFDTDMPMDGVIVSIATAESIMEVYITDRQTGDLIYEEGILFHHVCPSHYIYHYSDDQKELEITTKYAKEDPEAYASPLACLDKDSGQAFWHRASINIETGKVTYHERVQK